MSERPEKKRSVPSPTYAKGLVQRLSDDGDAAVTDLFFTTNPGLEDVVAGEFHRRTLAAGLEGTVLELSPFDHGGHILARTPHPFAILEPIALRMRSIHHLLRPLYSFQLPEEEPLAAIRAELRSLEIEAMRTAASFRVTTRRVGSHPFTSVDVQRVAGAALVERYACPVDLDDFELEVRVDVYARTCLVGLQLTRVPLSKRYERVYRPRAALRTPVAYAMLQFAGLEREGGRLIDPFCGSGTILIEAAHLSEELELFGGDLFEEAVAGVRRNLQSLQLADRISIRQADARQLGKDYPPEHFRAIVTNPPYGVQLGQKINFSGFYRTFLEQAWKVLQAEGILVLTVWKRGIFTRVLRQYGRFRQLHVRVVETGDLYPRIFVLQKPA